MENTIKDFNTFGVMIDCSRNAVMSVKEVKHFASLIAKMGYNTLMIYTEDTYEVKNEPLFGAKRGRYSLEEIREMDTFCKSIGIELVPCIQTLAHLSTLLRWSEYKDISDIDDILLIDDKRTYQLIENMFKSLRSAFSTNKIHIGMDFDSFMLLDEVNKPSEKAKWNPCKYMLFNDPFTGLRDYLCSFEDSDFYINLSKKIADIKDTGEYEYIFDECKKLCDLLAVKCNLGLKTRAAYKAGNKKKLKELASNDYENAIKLTEEFHSAFQNLWFKENKPYGFDVQDIRFGGLIMRLKTCKERLLSYAEGKTDSIPELKEEQTDAHYGNPWLWGDCVTPNSLN